MYIELDQFQFKKDQVNRLMQRVQSNNRISFMVYNQVFLSYYEQFPRLKAKHICWVLFATVLLGGFSVLLLVIIRLLHAYQENKNDQNPNNFAGDGLLSAAVAGLFN